MNTTAQKNELIFGYSSGNLGEAKSLFTSMYLYLNSIAAKKAAIFNNILGENLSEIEIDLIIDEERKWKKIILNTHASEVEDKSFTFDAKFTDATLRVKNKFGFDCILKAKIKPHGDLLDHYRDYGPGYDPIYAIPSLKVKLKDNFFY